MRRRVSPKGTAVLAALLMMGVASFAEAALSPPSLTATAISTSQIRLSWSDPNPNEAGHQLERSLSSFSGFVVIANLGKNATSYTATGLAASTTYYFRVKATSKGNGVPAYSNVASARTLSGTSPTPTPAPGVVPAAPINLAGTTYSSTQIHLTWVDNSSNETGFKIERGTSSAGPWVQLGTTATTSWLDGGLAPSTTYYYRVRAYNAYGNSAYSNTDSTPTAGGTAAPAAPSGASASAASASQINVAWSDLSSNEYGFKIERSTATTSWAQIATVGANVKTYASTGLSASTVYYYRVRAYNGSGDSAYSNTASATTLASSSGGGSHIWSKDFGGPNLSDSATPTGIAVDGTGASVIVGYLQWRADFGGGLLTSAGAGDIYLAKYAASGAYQWSKRFGGTQDDRPKGVAVDPSGNVYITGLFRGTVNFGGGDLTAPSTSVNVFLAKYSPAGAHLWSLRLGTGSSEGTAVAVDGSGNVILAGAFYSTSSFGGGSMTTAGGADIFLAKYSSAGAHLWSKRIGGAGDDMALSVAADTTTGEILVTGSFVGSVNFGGATLTSAGLTDVFLAKYSSTGAHSWSRRSGGTADDKGHSVAVDRLGNAVVTGIFRGNVDFGGGALSNTGGADIFLAKYSVSGAHSWSRGYGSPLVVDVVGYGVDCDSQGNVLLTGIAGATIDFGGGPLSGDGYTNPFLAKFGPDASHIWSKRYLTIVAPAAHAAGRAVAADGSDNVLATGDFNASINFGGSTLSSPGGLDSYLVKLGP